MCMSGAPFLVRKQTKNRTKIESSERESERQKQSVCVCVCEELGVHCQWSKLPEQSTMSSVEAQDMKTQSYKNSRDHCVGVCLGKRNGSLLLSRVSRSISLPLELPGFFRPWNSTWLWNCSNSLRGDFGRCCTFFLDFLGFIRIIALSLSFFIRPSSVDLNWLSRELLSGIHQLSSSSNLIVELLKFFPRDFWKVQLHFCLEFCFVRSM